MGPGLVWDINDLRLPGLGHQGCLRLVCDVIDPKLTWVVNDPRIGLGPYLSKKPYESMAGLGPHESRMV